MSDAQLQAILLVEDHKDSREMIKFLLENLNYRVLETGNGQHALDLAAREEPDLIMTDFNLPDIDGTMLVRRMRQLNEKMSRIPIIMLTANDQHELSKLAIAAGCSAFFTKPIDFAILEKAIVTLLAKSRETNGPVNNISH